MVNQQSFAAKPQTVNPGIGGIGSKYREEDEYFANIHFDKRVHRGSNYSRPSNMSQEEDGPRMRVVKVREV